MFPVRGSVLIADGNGKVNVVAPTSDNQFLMLDSSSPVGAKFVDIKGHIPNQRLKINATQKNSTTLSSYDKITDVAVPGENTSSISSIKIISFMDSGMDSYSVKIINSGTGQLIAENTFTNTTPQINTITNISNLPLNEAIIEFSIRRNGGNGNRIVYLYEATIEITG